MIRPAAALLLPILVGGWQMSRTEAGDPALLSRQEARRAASRELAARLPIQPAAYHDAARGAEAAEAWLVAQVDRPGAFYYLVPFVRRGLATLLLRLDATTGRFQAMACLREPRAFPPLDEAAARARLIQRLGDGGDRRKAATATARLVWRPCEQTQSPFEPLWRFQLDSREWYVAFTGEVHDRLDEPRLKGGGPPGR